MGLQLRASLRGKPILRAGLVALILLASRLSVATCQESSPIGVDTVPAELRPALLTTLEGESYAASASIGTSDGSTEVLLQASNRAWGIQTSFMTEGSRVLPTQGADSAWEWGLEVSGIGRGGDLQPVELVAPLGIENRVEYRRADLVEWYVNDAHGLEHGFTVQEPPCGALPERSEPLELCMRVHGGLSMQLSPDDRDALFLDREGIPRVSYAGLKAWDAGRRALPAWLSTQGETLRIQVDDQGATYPVTIDPLCTTQQAKLVASDAATADQFGDSVSIDGDTAAIGAVFDDDAGGESGSAYIFVLDGGSGPARVTFYFGDGSGTPCPCANAGGSCEGCANGGGSGAVLLAGGSNSVSADDLVLGGVQLVPNQPGLYFQGLNAVNGGSGNQFGDGLRCVGGSVIRLQVRVANGGGTSSTTASIATTGNVAPGDIRRYQPWNRDPASTPCGSTFNLSPGVKINWVP